MFRLRAVTVHTASVAKGSDASENSCAVSARRCFCFGNVPKKVAFLLLVAIVAFLLLVASGMDAFDEINKSCGTSNHVVQACAKEARAWANCR